MTPPVPEPPIPKDVLERAREAWPICSTDYEDPPNRFICDGDGTCDLHTAIARALLAERERALEVVEEAVLNVTYELMGEIGQGLQNETNRALELAVEAVRALKASPR